MSVHSFRIGAAALLAGLLLTSCNQGIPDDIPCNGDETCPTGYFCGSLATCRDMEVTTPPRFRVAGVSRISRGPFEPAIALPSSGINTGFTLAIENVGGSEAVLAEVLLSAPECYRLPATLDGRGSPGPGEIATVSVSYELTLPCEPAEVGVEIRATSGPSDRRFERRFTGSFGVSVAP